MVLRYYNQHHQYYFHLLEAQAPTTVCISPIWSNQTIPATSSDVKICIDKQIFTTSRNAEFLNLQNSNK